MGITCYKIIRKLIATYTRRLNLYLPYEIVGMAVKRKDLVSDLGVLMDSNLLFPQRAESVVSKARRNVCLIELF